MSTRSEFIIFSALLVARGFFSFTPKKKKYREEIKLQQGTSKMQEDLCKK
jgi:hypothetical protein